MDGFVGKADRDLHATEKGHALRLRCGLGLGQTARFIVIGQGPKIDALLACAHRQGVGAEGAIRDGGMAVQVGIEVGGHQTILGLCLWIDCGALIIRAS